MVVDARMEGRDTAGMCGVPILPMSHQPKLLDPRNAAASEEQQLIVTNDLGRVRYNWVFEAF